MFGLRKSEVKYLSRTDVSDPNKNCSGWANFGGAMG